MDINSFWYFISIADCRSFSEAAERNYVSQSSLSKIIISLEKELGTNLFDRKHHPVSLTPAGRCFYEHVKKIEKLYNQTIKDLSDYRENKIISCYSVPKSFAIRNALVAFQEANPDIELNSEMSSNFETVIEEILKRNVDIAITHQPFEIPEQIGITFLFDDELYVVVSKEHEFAQFTSVSISKLSGQTFIETPFSMTLLTTLTKYYDLVPGKIKPLEEPVYREEVLQKVARGEGISIYFGRDISYYKINNIVTIKLDDVPTIPMVLLENKNRPIMEWHDRLRQYLKDNLKNYVGPLDL